LRGRNGFAERRLGEVYRGDEAITDARDGFNEALLVGGISQSAAEFFDRCVYAVLKINKSIRRPELRLQFFASNYLAGALQQQEKDFEGLAMKLEANSVLVKAPRTRVHGKIGEAD